MFYQIIKNQDFVEKYGQRNIFFTHAEFVKENMVYMVPQNRTANQNGMYKMIQEVFKK